MSPPGRPQGEFRSAQHEGAPVTGWRQARRVLAVRLDQLGDVLMTTPALAAVRESLPGVHLTLLTSPAGAAAAPHLPMVDEAWAASVPWMPGQPSGEPSEAVLVERLAQARFDAAVIFTVCTQSALPAALLCRMAGIPRRLAHSREKPYGLLTDWVPDTDQVQPGLPPAQPHRVARHEVERQLALVAAVGLHTADDRLRFAVQEVDRRRLATRLQAAGIAPRQPLAVLHPGASAASRRWPAARFGIVAQALAARGIAVVFSGSEAERALCDEALRAGPAGAVSMAGALALGELAALIEGARVLVANNSGPVHLAAALGTPVVDLYALTNPQHTPWRVASRVLSHDVPCRGCLKSVCPERHHACLMQVTPQQAAAAALALLHDTRELCA